MPLHPQDRTDHGPLSSLDELARHTHRLLAAIDHEDPGKIPEITRDCARSLAELSGHVPFTSPAHPGQALETADQMRDRLAALEVLTKTCLDRLRQALTDTEGKLTELRAQRRAARGYGRCVR